ncbi:glycosyltransferase family 2 protein [Micromonospora sp. NPDC049366]|uniref:glycosyltransferase family 2 protein n=1 Tax=Micromonospora sp. NPDC049366 TaxID=3364271 RepID=UPI003795ED0B
MLTILRRKLRARFGWMPMYELRNKVLLGHTALGLRRLELAETRRLLATLPQGRRPKATVAVVLLTYRRPEHLLRAVESVLAQTMRDLVLVVVDDGGGLPPLPDDPRLFPVSLARNVNVLGVSRNIGMRLTDSPFVAFIDDDNLWYPRHLEVALARLTAPDAPDGVYTAMRRVLPDGTEYDVLSQPFDRNLAKNTAFLDSNPFVVRRTGDVWFSRIRRVAATLPKEDWEMMYRHSRRHRIEHIPEATVQYLVNPGSYWTNWEPEPGRA